MTVRLWLITDEAAHPGKIDSLVALLRLGRPGSVGVVLRDKELPIRQRYALGKELRRVCTAAGQPLVVAERLDLARLVEADGVHLPSGGLSPELVRKAWPGALVSRAGHDVERLSEAELAGLDAIFVSPAFAPRKGRPALGREGLSARVLALREHGYSGNLYALGGVGADNVPVALSAGVSGVCVIGAGYDEVEGRRLLDALELI